MFTNVHNSFLSYSFDDRTDEELTELDSTHPKIKGLQTKDELGLYLERVVKGNDLDRYIRYNSNVERVRKLENGKWEIAVKRQEKKDGKLVDYWYTQVFDAIVLANGKTIPILPNFENLPGFVEKNKDKTFVTLAKAVKDTKFIEKSKKILFVGSSNSAIDLLQYAFPRDLENPSIFISRRTKYTGPTGFIGGFTSMSYAKGVISKPEIEKFLPDENGVLFTDGTIEKNFDSIVICTGYHYCYPFFEKEYVEKHPSYNHFYLYTFSLEEPTVALVGNKLAPFFFPRVEAQAAAVAGVFSGFKQLPNPNETNKWYDEKIDQILTLYDTNEKFIEPLLNFGPKDRPNPLFSVKRRDDYVADFAQSWRTIEGVYFKLRDGVYTVDNVLS
ncbi:unnamed protein product [Ambrosiozyma monospora]|uniref:Unnamed protein product n=1 Tax=Ambrosiozyma monospora TaxID=43982 RepID=A0A9W7DI09_AMBMO|nr:unnamed protein product [Ambrosiozyma monospora]